MKHDLNGRRANRRTKKVNQLRSCRCITGDGEEKKKSLCSYLAGSVDFACSGACKNRLRTAAIRISGCVALIANVQCEKKMAIIRERRGESGRVEKDHPACNSAGGETIIRAKEGETREKKDESETKRVLAPGQKKNKSAMRQWQNGYLLIMSS